MSTRQEIEPLLRLQTRVEKLAEAQEEYEEAMFEAKKAGFSYVAMAKHTGKTEAAVRMFFKRREIAS